MSWTAACRSADVAPNELKPVDVQDTRIIIVNYGKGFRAIPPLCPHMEEPLAESGVIANCALTCMKHLWSWNLETLEQLGETEKPLLTYDVREEDGQIWIWFEKELVYEFEEEDEMDDDDFFS